MGARLPKIDAADPRISKPFHGLPTPFTHHSMGLKYQEYKRGFGNGVEYIMT